MGSADGKTTDTTKAYLETNGPNGGPSVTFFPTSSYPWGNRWWTIAWTLEKDGSGHGQYYATYSLNYTILGYAWLSQPSQTTQIAQGEGYQGDPNGYCPRLIEALYGTNGNLGNLSWDASTEMEIANTNGNWVLWVPNNIDTTKYVTSPYAMVTYHQDDAFDGYGGG